MHNPAETGEPYLFVFNIAKNAPLKVRTDRHEIQARRRIVAVFQSRCWRQVVPPGAKLNGVLCSGAACCATTKKMLTSSGRRFRRLRRENQRGRGGLPGQRKRR